VSVGDEAEVPRAEHADFVGIGPVFGSGASDALGAAGFAALAARCGRPAVAIGGVDAETVSELMRAGASGVAVISALFGSRDPSAAARLLRVAQDASGR
jgi:thiamine-phosphate pyrophosphorylase